MVLAGLSLVAFLAPQEAGVARLLPVGTTSADVMELTGPPRYADLMSRFTEAGRRNPDWFRGWVAASGPGPLPWHPNLGLSESEYAEFLTLSNELRYRPARKASITVVETDGWLVIDGDETLPRLAQVAFDPVSLALRTPFGKCAGFRAIEPSPRQRATGPWKGITCSAILGDPSAGPFSSVVFHLGRLVDDGRVFFSYSGKRLRSDGTLDRADVHLRYAAP